MGTYFSMVDSKSTENGSQLTLREVCMQEVSLREKLRNSGQLLKPGTKVSLEDQGENGSFAEIVEFRPERSAYEVARLDQGGESVASFVDASQINVLDGQEQEQEAEDDNLADLGAADDAGVTMDQALAFLAPGTRFTGNIAIPNEGIVTGRAVYEVVILAGFKDELGREVRVLQHSAYGDVQICDFKLTKNESDDGKIGLEYRDAESCCSGHILREAVAGEESGHGLVIRGKVSQLMQGEEGFYYPSSAASHTFELREVPERKLVKELRVQLFALRLLKWKKLVVYCASGLQSALNGDLATCLPSSYPRRLIMGDILFVCEMVCLHCRRRKVMLDSLSFATTAEKESQLKKLKELGLNLSSVHRETDEVLHVLQRLLPDFRRSIPRPFLEQGHQKVLGRCLMAYHGFEESYRRAEERPPEELLLQWKFVVGTTRAASGEKDGASSVQSPTTNKDDNNANDDENETESDNKTTCMICICEIEEDEVGIELPGCHHKFHFDCASSWLYRRPSCPLCRTSIYSTSSSSSPSSSSSSPSSSSTSTQPTFRAFTSTSL